MKYTDRRGLEVPESQVAKSYAATGLNRKGFEAAMQAARLEPWQATAILETYAFAYQWLENRGKAGKVSVCVDGLDPVEVDL